MTDPRRYLADGELDRIAAASKGTRSLVPIMFTDLFSYDGELIHRHEVAPPDDPIFGMAGFATYDQVINALTTGKGQQLLYQKTSFTTVAGQLHDYWLAAGTPTNGAFGTALTGTIPTSATTGAIPYTNATGPATMHLISMGAVGSGTAVGSVVLYDRVAEYPLNGTVTSGTWGTQPALTRDANGTSAGAGVIMFVENVGATANAAVTLNITYTNSGGTGSRTTGAQTLQVGAISTNRVINPTNQIAFPLNTTDVGVASLQSYVLGATATSTTINVVLARPLITIPVMAQSTWVERDCVLQIPSLPKIYDSSALSTLLIANSTTAALNASLQIAQN